MQRRLNALSDYLTSRKITESSLRSVERLKSSINIDRNQASDAIALLENVLVDVDIYLFFFFLLTLLLYRLVFMKKKHRQDLKE